MMREPTDGLFPTLRMGLMVFRARVEGRDGDYRMRLLGARGRDSARLAGNVLRVVQNLMRWLETTVDDIGRFIILADAILALIETLGAAVDGLGEALDRPWPPALAGVAEVADVLSDVGEPLSQARQVVPPSIIPEPSTLAGIQEEARKAVVAIDMLLEALDVAG